MVGRFDPHEYALRSAGFDMETFAPRGELLSYPRGMLLADMTASVRDELGKRACVGPYRVNDSKHFRLAITDGESGWTKYMRVGPFIPELFMMQSWYIHDQERRTPLVHTVGQNEVGYVALAAYICSGASYTNIQKEVELGMAERDIVPMNTEEVDELTIFVEGFFDPSLDPERSFLQL